MPHAEVLLDAPRGMLARSSVLLPCLFQIPMKPPVLERRVQVVGECVLMNGIATQCRRLLNDLERIDDLGRGFNPA